MSGKSLILKCCLLVVFVAALVLVVESGDVEGKTIIVDDDGEADYKTIQEAVDAAGDGDTIHVWEGMYKENVEIEISVILVGNGTGNTTLDASGMAYGVKITADEVSMSGFRVTGSGTSEGNAGIRIQSANNHIFDNECCFNNRSGINLWRGRNNLIENNNCSNNSSSGIILEGYNFNTVTNNNCSNNNYGIYLDVTNFNTIAWNTLEHNSFGIIFNRYSDFNTITNNTIGASGKCGILVSSSLYAIIDNNTMTDNGIIISGKERKYWNTHTIEDTNTLNEKPVLYYKDSEALSLPTGGGQLILANCSWTIIREMNYNHGTTGISAGHSSNLTIVENVCTFNSWEGLVLSSCQNVTVRDNNFSRNRKNGIQLYDTNDSVFYDNVISDNGECGVILYASSMNNTIRHNTIHHNVVYGMRVFGSDPAPVNATNNWWGNESGPYHPTEKQDGKGDNVTNYVLFSPWQTVPPDNLKPTASISSISPSPALSTETVHFIGEGTDDGGNITRYSWRSSIDGEFYNGTEPEFDCDNLSTGTHTISFKVQDNYGVWSDEATTTLTVTEFIPPNKLPTVTITSPEDGAELKGTVTIKGSATDEDGTVEKVELLIDGEWFLATGTTSWDFQLDTTTLANRDYTINVLAFDGTDYSEDTILNLTVNNEEEGNGDDGGDDDGPGFELIGAILGILVAVWWRRR